MGGGVPSGTDGTALGTRWLRFWTYAGLPAMGLVAILMSFHLARFRYEILPIAILCGTVALGLHERKQWGWQWNWIALAIVCLALLVPMPIRETHGGFVDFVAQGVLGFLSHDWKHGGPDEPVVPFTIRLIVVSLLWLLPNWLYWKKRQALFS